MWLLRGWPLLCLALGAQATRCRSSRPAAFVPALPRLPRSTRDVVRPSRIGFNDEVVRKYSQAVPGYPSVLANKGLAAPPFSGRPVIGAGAAPALRSLRMGGGGGRTHEKKDTRIDRNQDGGNEVSSAQPYEYGDRETPGSFVAGEVVAGESPSEGGVGDAEQVEGKVADAVTVGRKSDLTPTAASGGRRDKKPFRSKSKDAAQPGEQATRLGEKVSATIRKAESGASATAAAAKAAAAATAAAATAAGGGASWGWMRPPWITFQNIEGAKKVEPESATRRPAAGADTLLRTDNGDRGKESNTKKASSIESSARQNEPGPSAEKPPARPAPPLPTPISRPAAGATPIAGGTQRAGKRKRDAIRQSMVKLGWQLPLSSPDDARRTTGREEPEAAGAGIQAKATAQVEGGLLQGLPRSISLPAILAASVLSSWLPGKGGGEKEDREDKGGLGRGRGRRQGKSEVQLAEASRRPVALQGSSANSLASDDGQAEGGEGEAANDATSPGRPRTTAPTATTTAEAAATAAAAIAARGRRAFSRMRVAFGKPRSVFDGPQRTAAEATEAVRKGGGGSPSADSGGPTNGPVPPTLSMPSAVKKLRERSRGGLYFPVKAPWRPPGYRWGVSLLSKTPAPSRTPIKGAGGGAGNEDSSAAQTEWWPVSASEDTDREASAALVGAPSRRMRAVNKASGVAGVVLGKLLAASERGRRWRGNADGGAGLDNTGPAYDRFRVGKWAEVELAGAPGKRVEDREREGGDMAWWRLGAAVVVGVGAVLYRPVANRLPGLLPAFGAENGGKVRRRRRRYLMEGGVGVEKGEEEEEEDCEGGAQSPARQDALGGSITPPVQSSDATKSVVAVAIEIIPNGLRRGSGSVVASLLAKVATALRRAKLWIHLRRKSRVRAEPLLPGVDSGISTLSVPLTSMGLLPSAGEEQTPPTSAEEPTAIEDVSTAAASEMGSGSGASALAGAGKSSEVSAPQAVGGRGWNLLGFFPADKEEEQSDSVAAGLVKTVAEESSSDAAAAAAAAMAAMAAEPVIARAADTVPVEGSQVEGKPWLASAWLESLDPRAQVEAAMRETFRAAFGYDLGNAAAELSAETALAAANAAALAEGEGSAANLELQSTGPTARYLDELSPPSSEPDEQDVLRKGAEAAASAAGAAVGAAAGAAAGVAAEMAAAATSASYKVGSPFGWQEDGQIGWQEGGGWRKNKKKGEESFGEGSLGLRPRKIDPQKASEMVMDSVWSGNLKRTVPVEKGVQRQRQRPRSAWLFSAAVERSRLPQRWKTKAAAAAAAHARPVRDTDKQDTTLRRLGKVGVVEIASSMLLIASETAQQVDSVEELELFRQDGGMPRLMMALSPTPYTTKANGLAAIRNLLRVSPETVAAEILEGDGEVDGQKVLIELRKLIGAPGEPWSSAAAQAAAAATDSLDAMRLQAEAVQLMQELSLASEEALEIVRGLANLIPALTAIAYPGMGPLGVLRDRIGRTFAGVGGSGGEGGGTVRRIEASVMAATVSGASKLLSMLGVHTWVPRQPGQKGLRILSLDGGGTRGVLTIAILREVLKGFDKDVHEVFDVICGTSTGGILAMLFASEKQSLAEASTLYDSLIVKIFKKDLLANAKLVLQQAQYSSTRWESILEEILGDRRMIDTMTSPSNPKVVICSTIMNVAPLEMMLWRNYGYRAGQETVYKGDYRRKMRECVRATTAAPSVFTPLIDGDMMYADGAFKANNPTSIAVTEAKLLYPDVPIECVLSVGTGYYVPTPSDAGMSWGTVINQLVNSATDTEGIDSMMKTFLPSNQYFRFNPSIQTFEIDEIRPERLDALKKLAKEYVERPEVKAKAEELRRVLRGDANSGWPSVGGGGGGIFPFPLQEEATIPPFSPFPASSADDADDATNP